MVDQKRGVRRGLGGAPPVSDKTNEDDRRRRGLKNPMKVNHLQSGKQYERCGKQSPPEQRQYQSVLQRQPPTSPHHGALQGLQVRGGFLQIQFLTLRSLRML